jgi:para-aminobenzoate synthetase component I
VSRRDQTRLAPAGVPTGWAGLRELERWEWRRTDGGDPAARLDDLLTAHGLDHPASGPPDAAVVLLAGADGCAALAGLPLGPGTPVPAAPDLVAVVARPGEAVPRRPVTRPVAPGAWTTSWTDAEHAAAVEEVRTAVARGDVYQVNVVGHRSAPHGEDPGALADAVAALPGASWGGVVEGEGWAVGCASPEQLLQVRGRRVTTVPVKGTRPVVPGGAEELRASAKERAEHVMIVDLERNDLGRVAVTGSVEVEELYALSEWSGLWHAGSRVAAELRDDVRTVELLAALVPGGSVTGAPKHAACALLAGLEPVGRGVSMGALGLVHAGGVDLGLTIRTVAADERAVHLWAGGGVVWDSRPEDEVAEAHAKAAPVVRALAGRPSTG